MGVVSPTIGGKTTQRNTRVRKAKRYANSSISNTCTSRAKRSETGRQCAFATFESFKNRFSGYFTSAKSRRTTASLPSKLEADYFRSRYSNDGCEVQAPVHVASASSLCENGFDFFWARIIENRLRGGPPSRKRSFTRSMPSSRSVCQQSIFSSKTRRKLPSCYQFKRFKCLSSVRSLQDGGHPSSARYPAAQRLARQDRSEGRVFCDPNLARSQKIPALCLEANSPRICMSSVRSCSSPVYLLVNTRDMTLLLPDCKVSSIKTLRSTLLSQRDVSVRELSRLIGKLTASIQAVFPAPLHYRNLQQLKHQALSRDRSFHSRIPLSIEGIDELRWWLAHLDAWNGRALLHPSPDLGWVGGCLPRRPNRGLVVSDGAEAPYQLSGAPGGIVCDQKLYEKSVVCSCAPTHRQYFCGGLSQPFRWDPFVGSLQSGSCSVGVRLDTQYLPQCRAHSGQSERFSRLGVAQFSRFEQLETLSGNFPFPNANPRPLHDRPLCGSLELSTSPILQLSFQCGQLRPGTQAYCIC